MSSPNRYPHHFVRTKTSGGSLGELVPCAPRVVRMRDSHGWVWAWFRSTQPQHADEMFWVEWER